MAKIPFDIKYRPQIENGEYKVVTENNEPARIICWDSTINKERPIIAIVFDDQIEQYKADGRYDNDYDTSNYDLFIVTPEEELTEFEKAFLERVFHQKAEDLDEENREIFREDARCVLELAREQFIKDGYIIEKKVFHDAVEKVSPEVMKEVSENVDKTNEKLTKFEKELESFYNHHLQVCTYDNQGTVEDSLHDGATKLLAFAIDARAREMDEALEKSKLDKDSIPYHLIEFMCNLHTCPNWKEIEGTAELYVTRLKAAAMKDLPRWEKKTIEKGHGMVDVSSLEKFDYIRINGYLMKIEDLEKLPGFKEDEK